VLLRQLDEFATQSPRLGSAARVTVRALGLAWLRLAIPHAIKPLETQASYSEFKRAVKAGVLTMDAGRSGLHPLLDATPVGEVAG
jgi:hypothetical protein